MSSETDDLLAKWKAAYGKLFPYRNPDVMSVDDATKALGLMFFHENAQLRHEVAELCATVATLTPPPQITTKFTPRGKILDALAKHNPTDPE